MNTSTDAKPIPPEQAEKLKELVVRRDELLIRIEAIKKDMRGGLDKDWSEQAVQLENAEVRDEIARVASEDLAKVNEAILRIENLQRQ